MLREIYIRILSWPQKRSQLVVFKKTQNGKLCGRAWTWYWIYWILLNIIEYYWILLNIIEYYWMVYWYTPQDCTSAGNIMVTSYKIVKFMAGGL